MEKTLLNFRKILGFERTRSLLGKHAQKVINHHRTRRVISVVIIALVTSTFLIHNFANMGGPIALNLNSAMTPSTIIDARTSPTAQLPLNYIYESRGFSWFHSGADLVVPVGTPVKPIMEGTVEATPYDPLGYGEHVIVDHENGLRSIYGHLSVIEVKEGDKVTKDTVLGKSGSTGFSTGPHLHLELQQNGVAFNPADIVPGIN